MTLPQLLSHLLVLLNLLSALIYPRLGEISPAPEAITIQKKEYSKEEYQTLKTSLSGKVDNGTPLKMDEQDNEQQQFFEAVEIERQKCGGKIGAVNGNVVEAMSNLLKNGCPK